MSYPTEDEHGNLKVDAGIIAQSVLALMSMVVCSCSCFFAIARPPGKDFAEARENQLYQADVGV